MSLIFVDLETTGLDPAKGEILEIAAAEVDAALNPIRGFSVVIRPEPKLLEQLHIDAAVVKMHAENGLWDACMKQGFPTAQALGMFEFWLGQHLREELRELPHTLAGDSVHFDRAWLLHHAPTVAAKFSHRLLDVSAFRVARELLGLPGCEIAVGGHRAESDVMASIAKAKWHLSRLT
jgi:oligoribonuclease